MRHLYLSLLLFCICVLTPSYGQIPITAGTYFPPNTALTEDGVPVLNRRYSRNDAVHYPGPQGLDHYTNFVNDPYVSTEDLASIISTRPRPSRPTRPQARPRPELRSGSESYTGDRIRWSAPFQPSSSSSYSRSTSSYTQTPNEPSGRMTTTRQWNSSPSVQRFDTQRGQVSARVVDMRTDDDDQYRRGGGDTRRTNTDNYNYRSQPARPETRALDYNPSIFPTNTRSVTGNSNVDAYWQQRRQGSGADYARTSSSSSWPSASSYGTGSNYYDRRQESYPTQGQYRAPPRYEPNYPILNDKETAAKAGVPNTVVITV